MKKIYDNSFFYYSFLKKENLEPYHNSYINLEYMVNFYLCKLRKSFLDVKYILKPIKSNLYL